LRFPANLQELEFSHNALSYRFARFGCQGMEQGQRRLCASKLPPKAQKEIKTIFNQFSNTLARHRNVFTPFSKPQNPKSS
jgi:hypothetical protein